ncbi:hypothetical protein PLESTM_001491300 [Pleodorina starrii]|nr:hypothetical protein PLESTM_001491300 [Pleodorina starrii]
MSGGGGRGSSAAAAPEPRAPPAAAATQAASEAPDSAAVAPLDAANCISGSVTSGCASLGHFGMRCWDQEVTKETERETQDPGPHCNRGVNFMLDNDPRGAFRLAALQSPAGRRLLARCGRSPDDLSSIVLVEPHRHFIRSEAILRIGAALRVPLPLLAAFGFPVPLPLRDAFYDAIANTGTRSSAARAPAACVTRANSSTGLSWSENRTTDGRPEGRTGGWTPAASAAGCLRPAAAAGRLWQRQQPRRRGNGIAWQQSAYTCGLRKAAEAAAGGFGGLE